MSQGSVLPVPASALAERVDAVFWTIAGVATFFAVLVLVLVLSFSIRYRRRAGSRAAEQVRGNVVLEWTWTALPLAIATAIFVWASRVYVEERRPPRDAQQVYVVAKQWMWKFQHPEGPREIDELHVPLGRPVSLLMTSEDVIHSLFVPAFRMKMDLVPGRYTTAWFVATRTGEFRLFCSEYCGTKHSGMVGRVVVEEPADYQEWLAAHAVSRPLAVSGEELFRQYHCDSCHGGKDTERGPALGGLVGRSRLLADGRRVVADADYVRESVVRPAARVVAGWAAVMPSFEGRLDEEQLVKLLAYVEALPPAEGRR